MSYQYQGIDYRGESCTFQDLTVFGSIFGNRIEGVKHFAAQNQLCTLNGYGNCPLSYAIKFNQREIIDFLITEYQKLSEKNSFFATKYLNCCDSFGYSTLAYAVANGDREIIDYLITAGTDINIFGKYGKPPLSIAVEKQDFEMVKYLIEKGATGSIQSAFFAATRKGNLEIIKYLHNQGALINFTYLNDGSTTPLINSIRSGNTSVVKYLIENGAKIEDIKKYQLLWQHVNEGNYEMVSLLIELGVDLDKAGSNDCTPNCTPLTEAVKENNFIFVKQLLKAGASVNKCDYYEKYPLSYAIMNSSQQMVELLIESGADISLVAEEIEDYNLEPDFFIYLESRKRNNAKMETGHEEATL